MKANFSKTIRSVLIICISILFIYLIFKYRVIFKHISLRSLRRYILSFGPLASIALVALFSLKPIVIFFPTVLLITLAGNVFGPVYGFLLSITGLYFSGSLAFYLSKSLGKPFVDKITRGKLLKLDDNIEHHAFKIISLMRVSTLFPYDPLSYAAGLTSMKYRDFILGSMVGIIPEILAYSYLGQSMRHPLSKKIFIPIFIIFAIALLGMLIYKVYSKPKRKKAA
jgi:uncharacterized membrane protein YdjX (TVP38/TMEM64 family)